MSLTANKGKTLTPTIHIRLTRDFGFAEKQAGL
jgi:hypothetical protein